MPTTHRPSPVIAAATILALALAASPRRAVPHRRRHARSSWRLKAALMDADMAIALYRRITQQSSPLDARSPYPEWGIAEAWMSLAYAHVDFVPDLAAAIVEADTALRLEPRWWFVREVLRPRIAAARAAAARPAASRCER